jgi:uncharacterized protein YggT (Ycf19 family)
MSIYRALLFLINAILAVVELFLGLRFLMGLLGANPRTPFVAWIRDMSDPLLEPFRGAFPSPVIEGGYVFEFNTLFAIVVYALAAYILVELLVWINHSVTGVTRTGDDVREVREVHHYHEPHQK